MKKTEKKEVVKAGELKERLQQARAELTKLRMDNQMRKLKNTSLITMKRKEIARFLTAKRIVEMEEAK